MAVAGAGAEPSVREYALRRAFAEEPLLWAGEAPGFVTSAQAACGGEAIARALGLIDPTAALPGLESFLLDTLRLRQLGPSDGLAALRALAEEEATPHPNPNPNPMPNPRRGGGDPSP